MACIPPSRSYGGKAFAEVKASGARLQSGEDGEVDAVLQVVHNVLALLVLALDALAEEDHGSAGPTQRLVRCGGHHV